MNQKIVKNGTNVVAVTKYKDITPELMLMILKSGINALNLSRIDEYAKPYVEDTMNLIKEYVFKLETIMPEVGVIRCANRGLEALMSIREDKALKRNCEIWSDTDITLFKKKIEEDLINSAVSETFYYVQELVNNANFETLWGNMNLSSKNELLKDWGLTWKDCIHDDSVSIGLYTKFQMISFEHIMGREFEEFDQYLRA